MKKQFILSAFALLLMSFSANVEEAKSKTENEFCKATCRAVTSTGYEVEITVGNFLTGCRAAERRCNRRLARLMAEGTEGN